MLPPHCLAAPRVPQPVLQRVPPRYLLYLQFTDEFIDTYVRCATEELPLPDLGLTLSFIELMGGALKDSTSPIGLKEGGGRAQLLYSCGAIFGVVTSLGM